VLPPLILQISIVIASAFIGGLLAHKLKLPILIGYIFIGIIFGIFFGSAVGNTETISFFSEIGIALLLFTLGLEFNLGHLKLIGKPIIYSALIQIGVVSFLGFFFFSAVLNINYVQSLFLSLAVSLSSTAVVARILFSRGETNTVYGELSLGMLIVQDIAVLPIMVILSIVGNGVGSNFNILSGAILPIVKAGFVLYLTLILGRKTIPYLFKKLAIHTNSELLLLISFAFAILFAYFSNFLGVPFAVGAFLAGLALSSASVNREVFSQIRPIRDFFSTLFFVSIGFWTAQSFSFGNLRYVLLLFCIVLALKLLTTFIVLLRFGFHSKIAFYSGAAIFGIGEFSFVIGKYALDLGIFDSRIFNILITTTALTLVATPFAFRYSQKYYKKLFDFFKIKSPNIYRRLILSNDTKKSYHLEKEEGIKDHVIVIGYGRVGREVTAIFDFAKVNYVVIDYDLKHLKELKNKGRAFVYGDAENEEILLAAGLKTCRAVLIAIPDVNESEIILNHCLRYNPEAKFIARAHKDVDAARLKVRGVSYVVEPEFEASLTLVRHSLYSLEMGIEEIETLLAKARKGYRF